MNTVLDAFPSPEVMGRWLEAASWFAHIPIAGSSPRHTFPDSFYGRAVELVGVGAWL